MWEGTNHVNFEEGDSIGEEHKQRKLWNARQIWNVEQREGWEKKNVEILQAHKELKVMKDSGAA